MGALALPLHIQKLSNNSNWLADALDPRESSFPREVGITSSWAELSAIKSVSLGPYLTGKPPALSNSRLAGARARVSPGARMQIPGNIARYHVLRHHPAILQTGWRNAGTLFSS